MNFAMSLSRLTTNWFKSLFAFILLISIHSSLAQTNNTHYGTGAGSSGSFNSMFGYQAGDINIGSYGSFFGEKAGLKNTSGSSNVFIGRWAGKENTTSSYNSYIGFEAGSWASGAYNTVLGANAGRVTVGSYNVFIGYQSGKTNSSGTKNTFLGYNSGNKNTTGSSNTFLGSEAGYDNNSGTKNVFLGYRAGYNTTTGSSNVFIGYQAGFNNATASNKLYIDNSSTATPLIYGDFSSNVLTVNGNLGVGSNNPVAKLDVLSSGTLGGKYDESKAYFRVGDGNTNMIMDGNEISGSSGLFIASGTDPGEDIYFRNVDTNGAEELMIIKTDGNVGIGTTSPLSKLDVNGAILSKGLRIPGRYDFGVNEGAIELEVPTSGYNAIRAVAGLQATGTIHFFDDSWGSGQAGSSAGSINFDGKTAVTIGSWNNPGAYFRKSDGFVGIGVTNPSERLDVNGKIKTRGVVGLDFANGGISGINFNVTGVNELKIQDEGEGINFHDKGEIKIVDDNTDDKFFIGPGYVGIGTEAPTEQLHVAGNIKASGTITASGYNAGNWNTAFNWGDHNTAGYYKAGTAPNFGDGLNLRGTSPTIHFNNTGSTDEASIHVAGNWFYILGHESSNGDSHNSGWDINGSHWPFRINLTNDLIELGGDTYLKEGNLAVESGNVGIGITSPEEKLHVDGNILFNNGAIISHQVDQDNNVDHIWHNDSPAGSAGGTWHFSSDQGYKANGSSRLQAGHVYMSGSDHKNYIAGKLGIGTDSPTHDLEVTGDAKVTGNLILDGDLVYGQGIDPDPQASKLLALDGFNKMVYHELNDVRNPWGLRFVQDALGTGLNCMEFEDLNTDLILQVDVLDIHGNLLLGNNGYIDDRDAELPNEDQIWAGQHTSTERDDWIHIAERIELSANNSVGEGVVIFGKNTTSTQFLNLTQDGNDSYLANSTGLSGYFLKATGRDIMLGGSLVMPVGSTATLEAITVNQNATITGQISTTTHGTSEDWHNAATDVSTLNNKAIDWDNTALTVTNKEEDWDDAYTQRVNAASGLSWDSSSKDLSVNIGYGLSFNASNQLEFDESSISIPATQVTGLPWNLSNGVLNYAGNAKVTGAFEAQNLKLTGLGVGDKSLDNVMVISSDGTVKSVLSSEFNTGGNTPWQVGSGRLDYTGIVEVDGALMSSSISTGTGTFTNINTSNLQISGLISGATFGRVLMEDGAGNLGYKDLSSFNFSHWSKDASDNLKYESGTITSTQGIYSEVGASDLALVVKNGSTTNFKVDGAGNIRGRKLELDLQTSWPDYVFGEDYKLRSLEEVETYVKANNHLPDVPSEEEVRENGIDVAEMESVLLQKVEELTLYIIEQNKTIKSQQLELKQQKDDFAARLEALEQKIGQ